ncbi:imidazole glycerol phosphate synthase subunit HisH [Desulfamplus magnetovallimortis]|nr:imidazole glycerol phosphate synthase subunit HisH [Desulfamplus magnetovallimortis]
MVNKRIIPRLDIKGPNLVKGVQLEGLRALGKAEYFARYYYKQGADELIYQDVVATLYGRNSLLNMIENISKEIFIPLTVGGGIRSLKDIRQALSSGADKVALNTAVVADPELINQAAKQFGSSTIVVSIEAKKMPDGTYQVFTDNGREPRGINVLQWAAEAANRGAGEILLISIDRDGTGLGFDIELIKSVSQAVKVPVIASGGAGSVEHIHKALLDGEADAVAPASVLHYGCIEEYDRPEETGVNESQEGNYDFIKQKRGYAKITPCRFSDLRKNNRTEPDSENFYINNGTPQTIKKADSDLKKKQHAPMAAIIDYEMGNLFSVKAACIKVGLQTRLCQTPESLNQAAGIIIPGVGAFGNAMSALKKTGMDLAIKDAAKQGVSILGVCLGMQLLMEQSEEFGITEGLGLISGSVRHIGNNNPKENGQFLRQPLKVPHIGWNFINESGTWQKSLLESVNNKSYMYFVHSFHAEPVYSEHILCTTQYGDKIFCSGVKKENITGFQFHPERSGEKGLIVYKNFLNQIQKSKKIFNL